MRAGGQSSPSPSHLPTGSDRNLEPNFCSGRGLNPEPHVWQSSTLTTRLPRNHYRHSPSGVTDLFIFPDILIGGYNITGHRNVVSESSGWTVLAEKAIGESARLFNLVETVGSEGSLQSRLL